jgi:hypothetical protein
MEDEMCRNAKRLASTGTGYSVNIRYLGRLQLAVSGTFTGNLYRFSPVECVQPVDHRDAFYLLSSGLFGVAS